jgi:gamma-glutamyltranspeptidase/glutathione hydrolase
MLVASRHLRLLITPFLALLLVVPAAAQSGRTQAPARNGMVVSNHYLASEAGRDVLKAGGNAIDAAVATAFALAVTLPSAGNIGGGGFLLYHGADGMTTSFNFREKAPAAATERMYLGPDGRVRNNSNHDGLLAVGVPGTVAGLWQAHQKYGKLPWARLVQPAIDLAEQGFPSPWDMQGVQETFRRDAAQWPSTARAFLKNGTTVYEPGELWKQPDLGRTLRRIQRDGRDGFYRGETARLLADFMRRNGGIITEADLANYEAVEQAPVRGTYRGYDVIGMAPPSSGGVAVIEMLNILEGYDLRALGHNSATTLHLVTEAMRRGFLDRARHIGDPAFNPDMPIARLTSKAYAAELRAGIDPYRASVSSPAQVDQVAESEETTHFSIVDASGNAVSLTYTLEASYGTGIVVEGAGFLLNNEMGDFNATPGRTDSTGAIGTRPNLVRPGARMLSSMTPTILAKEGKPVMVIGSPGGRTIINTVLQVIMNVVDHEMTIAQAIEAPRFHHQWLPDVSRFERLGFSPDTHRLYEAMGHRIAFVGSQGHAMGIFIDHERKLIYGGADSRAFNARAVGW